MTILATIEIEELEYLKEVAERHDRLTTSLGEALTGVREAQKAGIQPSGADVLQILLNALEAAQGEEEAP